MLHHYLQLGYDLDKLLNLTNSEKLFYLASMSLKIEQDNEKPTLF